MMTWVRRGICAAAMFLVLAGRGGPAPVAAGQSAAGPPLSLTETIQALAADCGAIEGLLRWLRARGEAAPSAARPLLQRLEVAIAVADWDAVQRFPTLSLGEIVEISRAAQAVGLGVSTPVMLKDTLPRVSDNHDKVGGHVDGAQPRAEDFVKPLGFGLAYGDPYAEERARYYPNSRRLAEVLNRLALNPPSGEPAPRYRAQIGTWFTDSASGLIHALQDLGHTVIVRDARYFANFGDLWYQGREVATPFWIDTQIPVPGRGRTLRLPALHSQYEISIRGRMVNADLEYYYGIDGMAMFRPAITGNQAWVLGRVVRSYQGEQAREAVRLAAAVTREYETLKEQHPDLPASGYFAFGACNDVHAMIELRLEGRTSLYPLTRDPALFPGEGEIAALARALPVDRATGKLTTDRLLGSLPTEDLAALPFPDLRADVEAILAAEARGDTWRR